MYDERTLGFKRGKMDKISRVAEEFCFEGTFRNAVPYGNGHINDTYALTYENGGATRRYILQKMNKSVFPDINTLMHNVALVTDFLARKIDERGGDRERETLTLIRTKKGDCYLVDGDGESWRAFLFIENTLSYQSAAGAEVLEDAGRAFGTFIAGLADFDASQLGEVIKKFHDTRDRYAKFVEALGSDKVGRAATAEAEVSFVKARKSYCPRVVDMLESGQIPLRVTHNDTKLNNVLVDADTKKAVCVVDLDTIMPGSLLYDFGDAVRFGCSTAAEDEKDLSEVDFDIELYEAFTKGFLAGTGDSITATELDNLAFGAVLMTYECGMRFLTDYLDGDNYFKTAYPEHNLVRCRTQFRLVERMEARIDEMNAIARKYAK